jgi:hypothetical protein
MSNSQPSPTPTPLSEIAKELMFRGSSLAQIQAQGWVLRKGKTVADINASIQKAKKDGMAKTEYELNMLELHLKSVLKKC